MPNLRDRVVLVTGAASGLGRADASLLAQLGARVIMTDVDEDAGRAQAGAIGATFLQQDVTDEARWQQVIEAVAQQHGRLDGLVNNAGIAPIGTIEDTTTADWRRVLAVHLDGTFFGCRAAVPLMQRSGGGSIVNMSSTAALIGIPDFLAYSAAKGGIRAMTKAIAVHCRRRGLGIRCNSVHPGSIDTPMVHAALDRLMGIDLPGAEDPERKRHELGIGAPIDVARMVAFLLSDDAAHVNGAELVIDNADTVV